MVNLEMKNLSFFLTVLLIMLMYYTPKSLKDISNDFLGKIFLVVLLSYIALFCDLACAIIFALIIIVLLHDNKEPFALGGLKEVITKTTESADNAERRMDEDEEDEEDDDGQEGFKESHEHDYDSFKGKKKKKEGFGGKNTIKTVNNKLRKYLGFSITDLDRQIKTSSEKNSQEATKDLI